MIPFKIASHLYKSCLYDLYEEASASLALKYIFCKMEIVEYFFFGDSYNH